MAILFCSQVKNMCLFRCFYFADIECLWNDGLMVGCFKQVFSTRVGLAQARPNYY